MLPFSVVVAIGLLSSSNRGAKPPPARWDCTVTADLGCYQDQNPRTNRTLAHEAGSSDQMTRSLCAGLCKNAGFGGQGAVCGVLLKHAPV